MYTSQNAKFRAVKARYIDELIGRLLGISEGRTPLKDTCNHFMKTVQVAIKHDCLQRATKR